MASTAQQPPTTGRREMMFCHECHDEWYRDQHGIICPECDSEFTEIVSAFGGFVEFSPTTRLEKINGLMAC